MSAAGLRTASAGLTDRAVVERDGMRATAQWLATGGTATVHVDPFDPYAGDPSALEFAAQVATAGHRLAYWYGYDRPAERSWAYRELKRRTNTPLWGGDLLVVAALGEDAGGTGRLGDATTAGTGTGMVLANVGARTQAACTAFGAALVDAYADATLPDGTRGHLAFSVGYPAS